MQAGGRRGSYRGPIRPSMSVYMYVGPNVYVYVVDVDEDEGVANRSARDGTLCVCVRERASIKSESKAIYSQKGSRKPSKNEGKKKGSLGLR